MFEVVSISIFQKQRAQTQAVEGRYANWQETVVLEMERDNDLHFEMANVNEQFELRLYDRILSPLDFDNRETNTIHEQVENRYLGQATIPFSTVYSLGKVDGSMNIQKPLFHSDYKGMDKNSQIKVLITTDPPLQLPQLYLNEGFIEGESPQVNFKFWSNSLFDRLLLSAYGGRLDAMLDSPIDSITL